MRATLLLLAVAGCTGEMVTPVTPADAGTDAGTAPTERDAGAPPEDAGTPPGVQLRDAGLLVPDGGTGEEPSARMPFTWRMAGAFIVANDPLTASPHQLLANHFAYVGQYALNNCANNTAPYGCAANGCNYPGNPASTEIPTWAQLASWLQQYQAAGLYAGIWGVTTTNAEAEGHCFAEIVNTLRSQHGVTIDLLDVDGEKAYETVQSASQRFVTELNATLQVPNVAKAYTPECHTAVPMAPWLSGGFTSIMPMAYWNDTATNPSYCLSWAYAYGVPKANAQVMLDGYKHGAPHTWAEYANDLVSVGGQGFSVWRTLGPTEWDQFKPLIETKGIAVYPGGAVASGPVTASDPKLIDGDVSTRAMTGASFTLDLGVPRLSDLARLWNTRCRATPSTSTRTTARSTTRRASPTSPAAPTACPPRTRTRHASPAACACRRRPQGRSTSASSSFTATSRARRR